MLQRKHVCGLDIAAEQRSLVGDLIGWREVVQDGVVSVAAAKSDLRRQRGDTIAVLRNERRVRDPGRSAVRLHRLAKRHSVDGDVFESRARHTGGDERLTALYARHEL